MISLPIKPSSQFWVVNEHASTAKDTQILLITGLAGACIVALTISLMTHLQLLVGLNAMTQWTFAGAGALLGVSALGVALGCNPPREPSVALKDPNELKQYLEKMCKELAQGAEDPLKIVQKYADVISLDMLQGATQVDDALALAAGMLREANFYLEARGSLDPSLQARLARVRDTLVSVLDNILAAFGIADFFKPADSAIHADFKFQKIMMLISLFTLLTATLLPMLGVTTGASIVGGCMLAIAVLSVIWPHIRPPLSRLPSGENWSEQVQSGAIWTSGGRKEVTTKIYHALKAKGHVLLTGPSGIGKTQTAQAFTQELENGEFPELAGKKVFYFNAAELVSNSEMFSRKNEILKRIEEAMGNHRDDYILIIDEVHVIFQEHENNPFGDKFKTFLDGMPYVIGLTTVEEYEKYIFTMHPAADRRFNAKIDVESTKLKETEAILNYSLARTSPHALVEPGAFAVLIQQTEGRPQPLSATAILSQCVTKTTHTESTPTYDEAEKKRTELRLEASLGVVLGGESLPQDDKRYKRIDALEQELAALEETCQQEAAQLRTLTDARKRLAEVRDAKWKLVHEMEISGATESELNQLMLLKYYLEPALEGQIKDLATTLKVKAVIDRELIQEALQLEQANHEKRKKAIEEARAQAQARTMPSQRNGSSDAIDPLLQVSS